MNRLANLALSVGETLVHEAARLLFGIALGRAKELLGTPQQLGTRQLALNRALQKKAVDGALLAGPRTVKEYAKCRPEGRRYKCLPNCLSAGNCACLRNPASKLAGRKAAASCRTPKLRSVCPHKLCRGRETRMTRKAL